MLAEKQIDRQNFEKIDILRQQALAQLQPVQETHWPEDPTYDHYVSHTI